MEFMSVQDRRKYDRNFKRNAVRLTEESCRTVVDVAANLGIAQIFLIDREKNNEEREALPYMGKAVRY
jgi:transposase-like protein